jgi:2',3'-cyclic-nucleotide 2'-phosphodiesterase (5'-nucleotidase family)
MAETLTLLQVNDSHAYIEPHQELFWDGGHAAYRMAGGYARIATVLDGIREESRGKALAFDCGDTIHGTYAAVKTRGEALVPLLEALRFDGMTAHWDFAYGIPRLKWIVQQLHYPLLAGNCVDATDGSLVFPPWTILNAGGLQAGIVGLASTIAGRFPAVSSDAPARFSLGKQELPGYIEELRSERVDCIVVLSHLGLPQDIQLATEVAGIDVLLSGHTHNRLASPVRIGDTTIIQSGSQGSFVGRLDLAVDRRRVRPLCHQLVAVDMAIPPDPGVEELANRALDPYREYLGAYVGATATALNRNTVLESTMDNLLLHALADAAGTSLAFSNGWRYGAPVPAGPLTRNDLWNMIPVDPPVSTVELRGDEIRQMMEENLERTFARNPYDQQGGYVKRCRGINVYVKIENPRGHRIQEIFVQGKPLDPQATYRAAFVTAQGVPRACGRHREDLGIRAVEAIEAYLAKETPVRADLEGSVVAI